METERSVSQYILERKLGEGGMAEVWEARHAYLGSRSAIKFLLPRFAGDEELEARFLNEGKRQAQLQHPNIVSAIDFLQVDGRSYLVMQYIEGQNLEDRIRQQHGPLPMHEVHAISWDVLSALDYAHSREVVHRDVKPSNILLDSLGRVCLSDFGIALAMSEESRVTRTGLAIGTAEYMSPEQILRPRAVDYRSDIYSFGCVLYAMLIGSSPFEAEGSTEYHIKDCHVRNPPPPMREQNPQVTPQIESVVLKCLEKDPEKRFQSCGEVMRALDAAINPENSNATNSTAAAIPAAVDILEPRPPEPAPIPVIAALPPPATPESASTPRRKKNRGIIAGIIAAVLIAAIGAYAYFVLGTTDTVLRMEGSTTIGLALAPALVKAYLASEGASDIQQTAGDGKDQFRISARVPGQSKRQVYVIIANGSGKAFEALDAGRAEIGMASRPINSKEHDGLSRIGDFRSFASENVIGLDGIAVIVNRANPLFTLSRAQIRSIFNGEVSDWSQVGGRSGPIHIFTRGSDSGTFDSFTALVMNGDKNAISRQAKLEPDGDAIAGAVTGDVDAIGYVGLPQIGNARALAVSDGSGTAALLPTPFTVSTEDYILSRRLFLYIPPNASPVVEKFVTFALSPDGQEVVKKIGFVPLQATLEKVETSAAAPTDYRAGTAGKRRMRLDFRFRPNSFELDNKALADVSRAGSLLSSGETVYLLGFADATGTFDANKILSLKRAQVVAERFRQQGLRVEPYGFSYEMPVGDNNSEEGREKNRRVEVWVR